MQAGLMLAGFDLTREAFLTLGTGGLLLVAVLEFYGLPIPPDLVLIPLVVARPELAPLYVGLVTAGSVAAGLTAHVLGRTAGRSALVSRFQGPRVERAEAHLSRHGMVTLGVGAFAPIPEGYEMLSVLSGVLGVPTRVYLVASLIGRGGRYGLEAFLAVLLGSRILALDEIQLYAALGLATLAAGLAYVLVRARRDGGDRCASEVR